LQAELKKAIAETSGHISQIQCRCPGAAQTGGALHHVAHQPQVAIDPLGAGLHQRVVISSDGAAARKAVGDEKSPARWIVVGIVDEKEPGVMV